MKYRTILADPPWAYRNKSVAKNGGGAEDHYPTMTTADICALPIIGDIRSRDCCLFLWATIPNLPEAFIVMDAWGFRYKTALTWVKTRTLSMGFWFRVQQEICLLGTRGNVRAFRQTIPNLFFAPVVRHSQKPEKFFQIIDPIIPRPSIELFARQRREGWDAWGNEVQDV